MKRFLKWLDNFWYHYKWRVIIVGFFVFVFVFCGAQLLNKTNYDFYVLYSGSGMLTGEDEESIDKALSFIYDDYNENGEKEACLTSIVVLSDEELEAAKEKARAEGTSLAYNYTARQQAIKQYTTELMTGQSYICFLSEYMYGMCSDRDRFVPLDEMLGNTPEGAYDGCAVRLFDTEYGKYFKDALAGMGEDTLVCVRKISVSDSANKKAAAEYENYISAFKNLVEFEVK